MLIPREEIGDEPSSKHIVDILKEAFLLDVLVCEEEGGLVPIYPTVSEENLTRKIYNENGLSSYFQIFNEVCEIVGAGD